MGAPLHRVSFEPPGLHADVPAGTTLRRAAELAGAHVNAPCGGLGTCGGCAVVTEGPLEPVSSDELLLLSPRRLAAGVRLACRARVVGDVTVRPESTDLSGTLRIVETAELGEVAVEPPERRGIMGAGPLLGAVVDIGTTTLVVEVVDLRSGASLGSASALNPQHPFGHDVLSRISAVASGGAEPLRAPIADAIETLTLQVLAAKGHSPSELREIAICGNTTMIHLLLGIDPAPLGVAPYGPAFVSPVDRPASEIGLRRLTHAGAYVLPGVSAFVGSDVTAGLIATRLSERTEPTLFLDLGTNGELVLRGPGGLLAASTAAGPALEGAGIAYGMRAETGAVERVTLEGEALRIETVGGAVPRGICGSGLLDLVAALLDAGVLDFTGRLQPEVCHPLASRVRDVDGVRAFEVADDVFLTQRDVRQVQLAKGAIASGIGLLLDSAGVAPADVTGLILAGGFGHHVRAAALTRMGMIPAGWEDRVTFAGNTAQAGTLLALLSSDARRRAEAVARHVETVDLASSPDFEARFTAALDFPQL